MRGMAAEGTSASNVSTLVGYASQKKVLITKSSARLALVPSLRMLNASLTPVCPVGEQTSVSIKQAIQASLNRNEKESEHTIPKVIFSKTMPRRAIRSLRSQWIGSRNKLDASTNFTYGWCRFKDGDYGQLPKRSLIFLFSPLPDHFLEKRRKF